MPSRHEEAMHAIRSCVDTHETKWKGMYCTLVMGTDLCTCEVALISHDVREGLSPTGMDLTWPQTKIRGECKRKGQSSFFLKQKNPNFHLIYGLNKR